MARLAIKGHPTRGSEVIALLEMLGGENDRMIEGIDKKSYYFINKENKIHYDLTLDKNNYIIFTLEQFEKEFPYKVGDKVIFTKYGDKDVVTIQSMIWTGTTIEYTYNGCCTCLTKDLQSYKEQETMEEKTYPPYMDYDVKTTKKEILPYFLTVYDSEENKHEIVATDGYEIKEENGKYYAVKKKPQYPKTYEECCDVLGRTSPIIDDVEGYKWELLIKFQELLVCRDAYWKIAGEQMGLNKPWKPDLQDKKETKYVIINAGNNIAFTKYEVYNAILTFPTAEMRSDFYENFTDLIEQCKEFL